MTRDEDGIVPGLTPLLSYCADLEEAQIHRPRWFETTAQDRIEIILKAVSRIDGRLRRLRRRPASPRELAEQE